VAETLVGGNLTVKQWENQFVQEYLRNNRFSREMGTSMNNIIIANERLTSAKGDRVVIPFVNTLSGSGVQGNTPLDGNEEELPTEGFEIPVMPNRNAVATTEWEEQKSVVDILAAAKPALKNWIMESLRGGRTASLTGTAALANPLGIIDNMHAFYAAGTYALYPNAAEVAVKDAWTAANSDRVQFGAAVSNNSSNDHSASLQNIDNTADKLTVATLDLAKSRMQDAYSPRVTPYRAFDDTEWYMVYAGSRAFRDLRGDTTIQQANREAWARYDGGSAKGENPLFRGGDLMWNGMIIREIPEIPILTGVGAGGIDVSAVFICGIGAVGVGWARRPRLVRKSNDDYEFRDGVGIMEVRGTRALYNNGKMNGMYRLYVASVA
jgi:hypothetical protein